MGKPSTSRVTNQGRVGVVLVTSTLWLSSRGNRLASPSASGKVVRKAVYGPAAAVSVWAAGPLGTGACGGVDGVGAGAAGAGVLAGGHWNGWTNWPVMVAPTIWTLATLLARTCATN